MIKWGSCWRHVLQLGPKRDFQAFYNELGKETFTGRQRKHQYIPRNLQSLGYVQGNDIPPGYSEKALIAHLCLTLRYFAKEE